MAFIDIDGALAPRWILGSLLVAAVAASGACGGS
jgi:hypothetical protein